MGLPIFSQIEIGVCGQIVDILSSHSIAMRFVADQIELTEITEDFKINSGRVGFDDKDIQSLGHFEHFMLRFNLVTT